MADLAHPLSQISTLSKIKYTEMFFGGTFLSFSAQPLNNARLTSNYMDYEITFVSLHEI